jgi:hypothetical protein
VFGTLQISRYGRAQGPFWIAATNFRQPSTPGRLDSLLKIREWSIVLSLMSAAGIVSSASLGVQCESAGDDVGGH